MIATAYYLPLIGESFGMWMNPRVGAVSRRRMEASIVVSTNRRMETRQNDLERTELGRHGTAGGPFIHGLHKAPVRLRYGRL
jgi:hypothetical protein